jgi:hypothetical protein
MHQDKTMGKLLEDHNPAHLDTSGTVPAYYMKNLWQCNFKKKKRRHLLKCILFIMTVYCYKQTVMNQRQRDTKFST